MLTTHQLQTTHNRGVAIDNCQFFGNTATFGGAIYISGAYGGTYPITNCYFENNFAQANGGWCKAYFGKGNNSNHNRYIRLPPLHHNIGAVYGDLPSTLPATILMSNSTFFRNSGNALGGAVGCYFMVCNVNDCIFERNSVLGNGAAVMTRQTAMTITNSRFFRYVRLHALSIST